MSDIQLLHERFLDHAIALKGYSLTTEKGQEKGQRRVREGSEKGQRRVREGSEKGQRRVREGSEKGQRRVIREGSVLDF